jgi:hypothetical protein
VSDEERAGATTELVRKVRAEPLETTAAAATMSRARHTKERLAGI